jgi:hypothetical protein
VPEVQSENAADKDHTRAARLWHPNIRMPSLR